MLTVIDDIEVIRACQKRLIKAVREVTDETRWHKVGFPGGTQEADVYYCKGLDFWMTLKTIDNRYWNCVGLGNPFVSTSPPPSVEINQPLSGIDRRIAGAFVEDESGRRYIAHSGKIGGGTKGVSKTKFLEFYPATVPVMSGDRLTQMYVVGRLDDSKLPEKIRNFAKRSEEFRRNVKQHGSNNEPELSEDDEFSPEFEGTKTYLTPELVDAACTHGTVVRALHQQISDLGIFASNSIGFDLYVRRSDGPIALLFEVKTNADTTSIYGAVGQLIYHGGAGAADRLVAVLPADQLTPQCAARLRVLGISTVTFRSDEHADRVKFGGLDEVLTYLR